MYEHILMFENRSFHMHMNQSTIKNIIPHFKHFKSNFTTLRLHRNVENPIICPCTSLIEFLNLNRHTILSDPLFSLWVDDQLLNNFSLISCVMIYPFLI